jgi:hypothetical protein
MASAPVLLSPSSEELGIPGNGVLVIFPDSTLES